MKYKFLLTNSKEIEIFSKNGIVRVDCIVEINKEIWIIDFKTGSYNKKNIIQINSYISQLKKIINHKIIKGFILWIFRKKLERVI